MSKKGWKWIFVLSTISAIFLLLKIQWHAEQPSESVPEKQHFSAEETPTGSGQRTESPLGLAIGKTKPSTIKSGELRCYYSEPNQAVMLQNRYKKQEEEFNWNLLNSRHPDDRLTRLIAGYVSGAEKETSMPDDSRAIEAWFDYVQEWPSRELAIAGLLTACSYAEGHQSRCRNTQFIHSLIERAGGNGYLWQLAVESHLAQGMEEAAREAWGNVYLASYYKTHMRQQFELFVHAVERNLPAEKMYQMQVATGFAAAIPLAIIKTKKFCDDGNPVTRQHCRRLYERWEQNVESVSDQAIALGLLEQVAIKDSDQELQRKVQERLINFQNDRDEWHAYLSQSGSLAGRNVALIESFFERWLEVGELVAAWEQLDYFRETYGPLLDCN